MYYDKTSPPMSPQPMSPPELSPPSSPSSSPFGGRPFGPPMSPNSARNHEARHTASAKRTKYLKRIFKFRQMDFEYAFWQMLYLFISPQKVYRNFQYRKNTKDQFARDDPAFLVLLSFWLLASSIGFAVVLSLHVLAFFKFIFWVIFVDCIGVGIVIATILWYISNKYLVHSPPGRPTTDVEWGYAFDVHLNAFFPLLMILHLFQLPFLNHVINTDWFFGRFFGNTLWIIALCYYSYITFLGYSALPFLKKTQMFLYPMTIMVLLYVISLAVGWNLSSGLCNFYKYRVF
ncbi:protein unc-50 homolog A-like [Lineus longissimus]|uniref:protein unc-50 homolog A-like n=1 Tax=Lineus longissimus TaxID=88925 RepID=UPI002B4C5115